MFLVPKYRGTDTLSVGRTHRAIIPCPCGRSATMVSRQGLSTRRRGSNMIRFTITTKQQRYRVLHRPCGASAEGATARLVCTTTTGAARCWQKCAAHVRRSNRYEPTVVVVVAKAKTMGKNLTNLRGTAATDTDSSRARAARNDTTNDVTLGTHDACRIPRVSGLYS